MSIRRRLSKLEKKADQANTLPKGARIACVSTHGLDDAEVEAKIQEIHEEYLKKYGTIEGLIIFLSAVPKPDPLPDDIELDL